MLKEKLDSAFSFFQTKSPPLIGVDISSSALKLVELSEMGKGSYRLERYAIEPLPRDVVTDGNIANLDQVAEALRRAHKRLGSRNRNIAMALPTAMNGTTSGRCVVIAVALASATMRSTSRPITRRAS